MNTIVNTNSRMQNHIHPIEIVNNVLSIEPVRLFGLIFIGILSNSVIKPLPDWLKDLYINSYLFKFAVLFAGGILLSYPVTYENIVHSAAVSIVILFIVFLIGGHLPSLS